MEVVEYSPGADGLTPDTRLYRYLSKEAFERLLASGISLTRMSTWPDRLEASDFSFAANAKKLNDHRQKSDFFASCWALQAESPKSYDREDSFERAQRELINDGSGSMWESYCAGGGVRISTTINRLDRALAGGLGSTGCLFKGAVTYCAHDDPVRILGKTRLEETMFYKRVGYRHEAEYRYVAYCQGQQKDYLAIAVGSLFEFLDEILVFPLKNDQFNALANDLHGTGVRIASYPHAAGTNMKNGKPFCRVSQLYGLVSQTIGEVRFLKSS